MDYVSIVVGLLYNTKIIPNITYYLSKKHIQLLIDSKKFMLIRVDRHSAHVFISFR